MNSMHILAPAQDSRQLPEGTVFVRRNSDRVWRVGTGGPEWAATVTYTPAPCFEPMGIHEYIDRPYTAAWVDENGRWSEFEAGRNWARQHMADTLPEAWIPAYAADLARREMPGFCVVPSHLRVTPTKATPELEQEVLRFVRQGVHAYCGQLRDGRRGVFVRPPSRYLGVKLWRALS